MITVLHDSFQRIIQTVLKILVTARRVDRLAEESVGITSTFLRHVENRHIPDGLVHSIPDISTKRFFRQPEVGQNTILDAIAFVSTCPCLAVQSPTDVVLVGKERPVAEIPVELLHKVGAMVKMLDILREIDVLSPADMEMTTGCTDTFEITSRFRGRILLIRPAVEVGITSEDLSSRRDTLPFLDVILDRRNGRKLVPFREKGEQTFHHLDDVTVEVFEVLDWIDVELGGSAVDLDSSVRNLEGLILRSRQQIVCRDDTTFCVENKQLWVTPKLESR
jgi:hypothetical protein